jgi:membrane protein DedA with SNARE-associated domain
MLPLAHVVQLLLQYRYALLFPIAVVEGPIVSILAGFLASTGNMNIYLAYLTVLAGDLIADTVYYAFGRFGGVNFVSRYGRFLRLTTESLAGLEEHFEKHTGKTLIIGKFSHGLGSVVLFSAGLARVRYPKFLLYNILSASLKSFVLITVGYYYGYAYQRINDYFGYASYLFIGLAVVLVVGYYFATKHVRRML